MLYTLQTYVFYLDIQYIYAVSSLVYMHHTVSELFYNKNTLVIKS